MGKQTLTEQRSHLLMTVDCGQLTNLISMQCSLGIPRIHVKQRQSITTALTTVNITINRSWNWLLM